MTIAAVILLRVAPTDQPDTGRADFIGRDCDGLEEALGHLREALALHAGDEWEMAMIVPNHTVAEIAGAGPPPIPS